MASNVIGQQNGVGEYSFTNLDNTYGGATTELVKMKESEVNILGTKFVNMDGVSVLSTDSGYVVIDNVLELNPKGVQLSNSLTVRVQDVTINTGDTNVTFPISGINVLFVDNANSAPCSVTIGGSFQDGFILKVIFYGTGDVSINGAAASGAADGHVVGTGCVELIWFDGGWIVTGQTASAT